MKVKIVNKSPFPIPEYKTNGSSGVDLRAVLPEGCEVLTLEPFERRMLHTGLYIQLSEGYEAQIRTRSGLAAKQGLVVLNSPGTIDSDYRGEICVILYNSSKERRNIENGDRIAQMVVAPYVKVEFDEVSELDNATERGEGGFGHTGVK